MVKRVFFVCEEEYAPFEIVKSIYKEDILVSDKFFERYKKVQEIAEAMRNYIMWKKELKEDK